MNEFRTCLAGACLLVSASAAEAHHSYAMFDISKMVTVQGTVSTLEWASPHVWLWVVVDDGKGGTATWGFETVSPGQLQRDYGWERNLLKSGDKVTVVYAPLKSGNTGGELEKVTLADGRVLATRFTKSNQPPDQQPPKN